MANDKAWTLRDQELSATEQPFIGHPLLPIPLRDSKARTERVSSYVELELLQFMEQYAARGGFRSVSEVLRRLAIIGAAKEGYQFTGQLDTERQPTEGIPRETNTNQP